MAGIAADVPTSPSTKTSGKGKHHCRLDKDKIIENIISRQSSNKEKKRAQSQSSSSEDESESEESEVPSEGEDGQLAWALSQPSTSACHRKAEKRRLSEAVRPRSVSDGSYFHDEEDDYRRLGPLPLIRARADSSADDCLVVRSSDYEPADNLLEIVAPVDNVEPEAPIGRCAHCRRAILTKHVLSLLPCGHVYHDECYSKFSQTLGAGSDACKECVAPCFQKRRKVAR